MADQAQEYDRLATAYRKLVSDYRVELRKAALYLDGFLPDWGQVMTPAEPRAGRPPRGPDADPPDEDIVLVSQSWEPSKLITADRLAELLAGLSAAWDAMNDAYAALAEPERASRSAPADVHAAATAFAPFTP